jgi:hypothetical protein
VRHVCESVGALKGQTLSIGCPVIANKQSQASGGTARIWARIPCLGASRILIRLPSIAAKSPLGRFEVQHSQHPTTPRQSQPTNTALSARFRLHTQARAGGRVRLHFPTVGSEHGAICSAACFLHEIDKKHTSGNEFPLVSGAQPSGSRLGGPTDLRKRDGTSKKRDNGRLEVVAPAGVTEQHRAAPFLFVLFRFSGGPRTQQEAPSKPSQPRPNLTTLDLNESPRLFFPSRPECSAAPVPASSPPAFHPRFQPKVGTATESQTSSPNSNSCIKIPSSRPIARQLNGHSTNLLYIPRRSRSRSPNSGPARNCPAPPCPALCRVDPVLRTPHPGPALEDPLKKGPSTDLRRLPDPPQNFFFGVAGSANRRCPGS